MTYLGAMVFGGASDVVTTVGLATEVRDEGPLRRTVLNRRIYRPNPSFSRSLSLIAAGELSLLSSCPCCQMSVTLPLSTHEQLCTTGSLKCSDWPKHVDISIKELRETNLIPQ
jgi:hypothetical protein